MSEDDKSNKGSKVLDLDMFTTRRELAALRRKAQAGDLAAVFMDAQRKLLSDPAAMLRELGAIIDLESDEQYIFTNEDEQIWISANYLAGSVLYAHGCMAIEEGKGNGRDEFARAKKYLLRTATLHHEATDVMLGDIYRIEEDYNNSLMYNRFALNSDNPDFKRQGVVGLGKLLQSMEYLHWKYEQHRVLQEDQVNFLACYEQVKTTFEGAIGRKLQSQPDVGPRLPPVK